MTSFLINLVSVLTATNQILAVSNLVAQKTGIRIPVEAKQSLPPTKDPIEIEFRKIMEMDDEAQEEVDGWIKTESEFSKEGAGLGQVTLNGRIDQRFAPVKKAYKEFLEKHPEHVDARMAYGSFLSDIGEDLDGLAQWEKALALNTNNPAAHNNLANYYGHNGPVRKAFIHFERALAIKPDEPLYHHNFGLLIFQNNVEARSYFKLTEQKVYDKAMAHYQKALDANPKDFPLATDLAQTYYLIRPFRIDDALKAWEYAMGIARDDIERQGIHIHLARVMIRAGRFTEARDHLKSVSNAMYNGLKERLYKNLDEKQDKTTREIGPAL